MATASLTPLTDTTPHHGFRRGLTLPAWPVTAAMAGYPLWWALGLGLVMPIALAIAMLAMLLLRRRLEIVPGVLPWLAFCVWLVPCALMLDSPLRLVGYGVRSAQLLSVAIVLLYVVGARERYTVRHAVMGMTFLWVCVVAGGYLGLLWPDARLPTLPGKMLPDSIAQDEFIRDLFNPSLAEVQKPFGSPVAFNRSAAPFPYANNWGGAIAMLTPIALAGISMARTRATRVAIVVVLVASLIPIGASSNRGMFLGLAVALGYVAARLAVRGQWRLFLGMSTVGLGGVLFYLYGGAAEGIATRGVYSDSWDGRRTLYVETFQRTLESPILGFGGPRPSNTVEVSVGTQGWIWTLMFSYGFVGLALFLFFLLGLVVRGWSAPDTVHLLMHSTLIAVCVMIPFYGLNIAQLMVLGVLAGVLLRDRARGRPGPRSARVSG